MIEHWSWGHTVTKTSNTAMRIVQTIAEGLPALQLSCQPPPVHVGDVTVGETEDQAREIQAP